MRFARARGRSSVGFVKKKKNNTLGRLFMVFIRTRFSLCVPG